MKTNLNFRCLTRGSAALALAVLAIDFAPPAFAQLAPAPAPVTASDAKDFDAADALFQAGDFKGAMGAFEKFRDKYKGLSPKSLDASFRLAVSYLKQEKPLFDDCVRELRALIANKKVVDEAKEMAQLYIAKAMTLRATTMFGAGDTEAQKAVYTKALGDAVKEFDVFLTTYPKSTDTDSALYISAQLLASMESYEEAVKRFASIVQRFQQSPFVWDAQMWIGKAWFISANQLLNPTEKGKPRPAKPDEIQKAKSQFDLAQPALAQVFSRSGDIALANEAIYYVAQMQLSRADLVEVSGEDDPKKKEKDALLGAALDAFRAVRSVEEVVAKQEEKIQKLQQAKKLIRPGTASYIAQQNRIDGIIANEEEKVANFKKTQDMYLSARISIGRIFVALKKSDEARTLLRYLNGQKDLWDAEKKKDPKSAAASEATVSALLCITYVESKNVPKSIETYEAFRTAFKGNTSGENLPLVVANLVVNEGQPDKAEEVVKQGMDDYKDWRFANDAVRILISVALQKGDFAKAAELADEVLSRNPAPDVEALTLYQKGTIQQAQAQEQGKPELAAKAVETFKVIIAKFPNRPEAEDAEFNISQILSGTDPKGSIETLRAFVSKYSGGGKSGNTPKNVTIAQYLLARSLEGTGDPEGAIKEYRKLIESWPESEPAPGAFFKIFDIYSGRKDYPAGLKVMDEFIQKYPEHENVYYAFNNKAEIILSGNHETKPGPDGKPVAANPGAIANTEAGAKVLYEFVDYEVAKNLKPKRGEGSLIKVADKWIDQLRKLPSFITMNNDQKLVWQKAADGVIGAVEKQLQTYPEGDRLGEALERLVIVQDVREKAGQVKSGDVDKYFNDLATKYGKTPDAKAKILFALSGFLSGRDTETALMIMKKAVDLVPEPIKKEVDGQTVTSITLTPNDYDRYLTGLFEKKNNDEITKFVARIRQEYPLPESGAAGPVVEDANAVALFWEAKVLLAQGKVTDAGGKFEELQKKFPRSKKVFEADYGAILGKFEQTKKVEDDYIPRLQKIVLGVRDSKDFELPAKALFLAGRMQEAMGDYDNAIDTYLKIHTSFGSVPTIAGDGLWAGAQLLEKQSKGEIKVLTKAEKQAAKEEANKKAKEASEKKAAADKKKSDAEKKAEPKDDEKKPSDAKPAPAKPADPTTAKADAEKK